MLENLVQGTPENMKIAVQFGWRKNKMMYETALFVYSYTFLPF